MIDARGYVAITSSLAAFSHAPGLSAYAASKAGVEAFADSLAHRGRAPGRGRRHDPPDVDRDRHGQRGGRGLGIVPPAAQGDSAAVLEDLPVDAIVGPLVDGIASRRDRICLPGFVRVAHVFRSALRNKVFERDVRKAAPEMRAAFVAQVEQVGVHRASMGPRWS